jgi:hypothetical protein
MAAEPQVYPARAACTIEPFPAARAVAGSAPAEGSLRAHRGFVALWFARIAAVAGSQMLMVAVEPEP